MKTKTLVFPAIFMFLMGTCTMEPLFYYTHLEYPPIKPIINGAPSKIVTAGDYLYAANRNGLWRYEYPYGGARKWESMSKPAGESRIRTLAAANNTLYLLGETGTIHEWDGTGWSGSLKINGKIQQIHGAGAQLFAGDGSAVYEITPMSAWALLSGPEGLLSGAAHDGSSAYISVSDGVNPGVFKIGGSRLTNERILGIVCFDGKLAAVDTSGNIHTDLDGTPGKISTGVHFTGAAAVKRASVRITVRNTGSTDQDLAAGSYEYTAGAGTFVFRLTANIPIPPSERRVFTAQAQADGDYQVPEALDQTAFNGTSPALHADLQFDVADNEAARAGILLLGIAAGGSGTFRCGYRELSPGGTLHNPGDNGVSIAYPLGRPTSIDPSTKNTAAIGNYPVNALIIIPDSDSGDTAGRPVILASTQQNGLWSYRFRRTEPQWNGENDG